jgi:hypothetical protein
LSRLIFCHNDSLGREDRGADRFTEPEPEADGDARSVSTTVLTSPTSVQPRTGSLRRCV